MRSLQCARSSRERGERTATLHVAWFAFFALVAQILIFRNPLNAGDPGNAVEVDLERGEVKVPCRFVNPSRLLEVFACHRTGPTHETVFELDASRTELTEALLKIGCRQAGYWDGTGPEDFEKNQGDRLLVLVRWQEGARQVEHYAEGILNEGETGYPMPVRGFSFGMRGTFRVEAKRDEESAEGVEISLGAALRQTAPHTLLSHPTSSRALLPWMLPPYLDTTVVRGHRELVEKAVPATLVLRRIRSEEEVVVAARRTAHARGLLEADTLYDQALPIAREIDGLKRSYEALLAELKALVAPEGSAPGAPGSAEAALRVEGLLHRGRHLCARIEERYLKIYGLEEEMKAAWVEKRPDLPQDARNETVGLARSGFRFEPLLAAKRVELLALDLPDCPLAPGEANLTRHALTAELEAIELERGEELTHLNLKYIDQRLSEAKEDAYLTRLFTEDRLRQTAVARQYAARRELARTEISELRGVIDGSWEGRKTQILAERNKARLALERARKEERLAVIAEEMRYAEADLESRSADEARKAEARTRLEGLRAERAKLEAELKSG